MHVFLHFKFTAISPNNSVTKLGITRDGNRWCHFFP